MKTSLSCVSLCVMTLALGCRSNGNHDEYESSQHTNHAADSSSTPSKTAASPSPTASTASADKQAQNAGASTSNASSTSADRQFFEKAAQGGMFEVESSRIAATKAVSDSLRDFGTMMIDDHGKANEELQALARSKGITVPSTLDGGHQRQVDELRDLSGATFDSRYHELQVAAHDGAIELFEKTARDSTDSDVRAFATKTLPTLRKHRAALDNIQIPR